MNFIDHCGHLYNIGEDHRKFQLVAVIQIFRYYEVLPKSSQNTSAIALPLTEISIHPHPL